MYEYHHVYMCVCVLRDRPRMQCQNKIWLRKVAFCVCAVTHIQGFSGVCVCVLHVYIRLALVPLLSVSSTTGITQFRGGRLSNQCMYAWMDTLSLFPLNSSV